MLFTALIVSLGYLWCNKIGLSVFLVIHLLLSYHCITDMNASEAKHNEQKKE